MQCRANPQLHIHYVIAPQPHIYAIDPQLHIYAIDPQLHNHYAIDPQPHIHYAIAPQLHIRYAIAPQLHQSHRIVVISPALTAAALSNHVTSSTFPPQLLVAHVYLTLVAHVLSSGRWRPTSCQQRCRSQFR